MTIVIQHIITHWTKRTRSAPGANQRNAVPDILTLPSTPHPEYEPSVIQHTAVYSEEDRFSQPKQKLIQHKAVLNRVEKFRCVKVRWDGEQIRVTYAYEPFQGGAPARSEYPRQVLSLNMGE